MSNANIDNMTIGQAREIAALFNGMQHADKHKPSWAHPLIGRRVLVRTYSAGVHIESVR